jgi:3-hydroxy acid dehydrogenase / malonic semialdehyde reductase
VELKDKTIFITGATAGFGHAMALRFAAEGARIVATGRRKDRLGELKKSLKDKVHTLTLDVRDKSGVQHAIQTLPTAFAEVDALINNAGLALGFVPADQNTLDDWEQMVDTNIKGVLYCTHTLLPQMVARDSGHIVNIGSIAGTYPYPGGNVYGATKAFLKHFSLNLRADLLGKNIRITNIEPGMVETEFSVVRFHGDEKKAAAVYSGMQPLTADDIASAVLFALTCPAHVNINAIEIMPTQQAFSPFAVARKS